MEEVFFREDLPHDIKRQIALEFPAPYLIELCTKYPQIGKGVCESNDFWRLKLQRDFPTYFKYFTDHNISIKNPKNAYMRKVAYISENLEYISNKHFPHFTDSERKVMFVRLYNFYQEVLNKNIAPDEIFHDRLSDSKAINIEDFRIELGRVILRLLSKEHAIKHPGITGY